MDDLPQTLRQRLRDLLHQRSTGARRQLVAALRSLADELEQRLAAEQRQQQRPASERVAPRARRAGPGATPGRFVRITRTEKPGKLAIYIGRQLWYDLGSPPRLDVQRVGSQIQLVPATGDAGFAVYAGRTGQMPRLWCTSAADLVADDDGRYAAEVRAGRLVVGDCLD